MLKLLGAALIIVAGTMAGWMKARQYANRPSQIRSLMQALKRLETEITYSFTPLPDALRRIAHQNKDPLRSLLMTAAEGMNDAMGLTAQESLHRALDQHWRHTAMKASERDVLHQLAYTLGTSDRRDQLSHMESAIRQLEAEEAEARDDQARYEKMFRSLGLLTSALIVILIY
ncbi:stage III sporulation protein AB [Paenibacillus shirakamiensis]|uniref:Stage III sporulation protein AB n=1 Tax=Paenibacillus shirakamiensis TaxID=1265935 RepID=A0ABS4JCH7_9BACL|nr:stage III sporulation protein SpoIIIAB [Paenibacillus shirakamiensis]MBP1999430.1 stage III sporulation protein AB [Paenibacillus shirakamiensis]